MHVSGVKQEQPDRRPDVSPGPIKISAVVRDRNDTRLAKVNGENPRRVIGILNSILANGDSPVFVDVVAKDGGNNRRVNISGERDVSKIIRILSKLAKQEEKARNDILEENAPENSSVPSESDVVIT